METTKELLSKAIAAVDDLTKEQQPQPTASQPIPKVDKIEQPTVILMK